MNNTTIELEPKDQSSKQIEIKIEVSETTLQFTVTPFSCENIIKTEAPEQYSALSPDSVFCLECAERKRYFKQKTRVRKCPLKELQPPKELTKEHLKQPSNEMVGFNEDHSDNCVQKCIQCNKTFEEIHDLNYHVAVHHQVRVYLKKYSTDKSLNYTNSQLKGKILYVRLEKINFQNIKAKVKNDLKHYNFDGANSQHIENDDNKLRNDTLITLKKNETFKCYKCRFRTNCAATFTDHFWTHKNKHTRKLSCKFCSKSFNRKRKYDFHLLKKHTEYLKEMSFFITSKFWQCDTCKFVAPNERSLKNHKSNVHSDQTRREIFYCYKCNFRSLSKIYLTQHIQRNCAKELKKYLNLPCKFCPNLMFKTRAVLYNHYLRSHGERPHLNKLIKLPIYSCDFCPYKNIHQIRMTSHLRSHERAKAKPPVLRSKIDGRFICQFCSKSLKLKKSLDDHILKIHKEVNPLKTFITTKIYSCNECSYSTVQKADLHHHLETHIPNREVLQCSHCPFETDRKRLFQQHTQIHIEKPTRVSCKFCPGKTYQRKKSLDIHYLSFHRHNVPNVKELITSKIHSCMKCSFESIVLLSLKRHMKNHERNEKLLEKPRKKGKYPCQFCNAAYKNQQETDRHILNRHRFCISNITDVIKREIFSCDVCSFQTVIKKSLLSHKKSHVKKKIETMYCSKCSFKTDRKHILVRHIRGDCKWGWG